MVEWDLNMGGKLRMNFKELDHSLNFEIRIEFIQIKWLAWDPLILILISEHA